MRRYFFALTLSFALLVSLSVPLTVLAQTGSSSASTRASSTTPQPEAPADAFYPLTNLPGLSDTLSSDTLPRFLNNLYRLCIGAVAVIAVLKIMQGGAMLMFNRDSFSKNSEAKKHIQNAILGLVLVLSPAILFGIINPDILNLSLNVEELTTNYGDVPTSGPTYSNSTQQRMCQSFEDSQVIPDQEGVGECSRIGSGWADTDDACCVARGQQVARGSVCCRYNREEDVRLRPQAPPDPEDNETGAYRIEYVRADRDYDSDQPNAMCLLEGTQRYNTARECQAALGRLNGAAARHTCADGRTEAYAPSRQEYDRINRLPPCPN